MFSVEVALSPIVSGAKLGEHCLGRWVIEVRFAEQFDDIRFPAAIDTPPAITLETEEPESAVVRIVSAIGASPTLFVMFKLALPAMGLARTACS